MDGIFRAVPGGLGSQAGGVNAAKNGRWVVSLNLAGELYQAFFDTQVGVAVDLSGCDGVRWVSVCELQQGGRAVQCWAAARRLRLSAQPSWGADQAFCPLIRSGVGWLRGTMHSAECLVEASVPCEH